MLQFRLGFVLVRGHCRSNFTRDKANFAGSFDRTSDDPFEDELYRFGITDK